MLIEKWLVCVRDLVMDSLHRQQRQSFCLAARGALHVGDGCRGAKSLMLMHPPQHLALPRSKFGSTVVEQPFLLIMALPLSTLVEINGLIDGKIYRKPAFDH